MSFDQPYRIVFADPATRDLEGIADDRSGGGRTMVDRILAAVESLAPLPHRNVVGGYRPSKRMPIMSLAVEPYMVYFRADDEKRIVRIIRVRHAARRPLKRFD